MNDISGPVLPTGPVYLHAEADWLAGVAWGTSRRWLSGYEYAGDAGGRVQQPPNTPGVRRPLGVSFVDLVEIAAIGRLRRAGFSLRAVRPIVHTCQEFFDVARPLTTLRFRTGGREVFVERGATLLGIGRRRGERAWREFLEPFLLNLDYSDEIANRWWPLGRAGHIVVDPAHDFGLPAIASSGVRTDIIRERFEAGDRRAWIAEDFNLKLEEVDRALHFELERPA